MKILVAYASKYGATKGIAERIAEGLRAAGQAAEARPMQAAGDLAGYDAFVVGSAAYIGSWLKEATEFVRSHQAVLATKPVWLFSSGPLGNEATDAQGRDQRVAAEPKEFAEFKQTINPLGLQMFFGALDPGRLGFRDRAIRTLPAGRALLPAGDFRDWKEIDAWAASIAGALVPVPTGS
jgi:menaquinone-dependent protoporphyrinogen oxidase